MTAQLYERNQLGAALCRVLQAYDVRLPVPKPRCSKSHGFSLIELLISLSLGLLLMAGLVGVFVNASQANREFHRASEQIENGRYAMDALMNDLHHAGFYGPFFALASAGAFPDPCALSNGGGQLSAGMRFAIQGFDAPDFMSRPDLAATTCGAWLPVANLNPGSDVFVLRRADTSPLAIGAVTQASEVYLQASPLEAQIQFGAGAAIDASTRADGNPATLFRRDGVTAAEIRKYRVHVYFVAPCSVPAGGGDICTGAADDNGQPIPTLKRLELRVVGGVRTMSIESISEGIEALQVDYGIDDSPDTFSSMTGSRGDGAPDRYSRSPVAAEYAHVVTLRAHILARNSERTVGYNDVKTYQLGLAGVLGPRNDEFKRHAYAGLVRVTNMSSRREIPQ